MSILAKAAGALVVLAVATGMSSCQSQSNSVKEQWEERAKFPSCGSIELNQGDKITATSHPEVTCMADAIDSGDRAELVVSSPTTEGGTIRDRYRLYPDGHLEWYIDSSDDPHARFDWELVDCIRPGWLPRVTCPDVGPD